MNIQSVINSPYKPMGTHFKGFDSRMASQFSSYSSGQSLSPVPLELWRTAYGFRLPESEEMAEYKGEIGEDVGFSTEPGGYGGGWIKSDIDVPLSTKDVHNCALLNLVNTVTNEQLLYHVYDGTSSTGIEKFIKKEFPRFDSVNIMPGDQYQTQKTVNRILTAVDNVNPKANKTFYHTQVENPEVVAVDGKLLYIKNTQLDKMSFKEVENYNYCIGFPEIRLNPDESTIVKFLK